MKLRKSEQRVFEYWLVLKSGIMFVRLFFFVLLVLCAPTTSAQSPVVLTRDIAQLNLAPHMDVLRDASNAMTIDQVAASDNWQRLPESFNEGFTHSTLWLRVKLERSAESPDEWLIEVNNAVLDNLRLYVPRPDNQWEIHFAGEDYPRSQWDLPYRNPIFRFKLPEGQSQTIWLSVATRNSVSAQITLWQPAQFGNASRTESLAYGLLLGAYATIIIIHFFFWRWTREAAGGWYALYVTVSFFHVAISFGYLQQYTGLLGKVTDVILSLLICGSLAIGAKMCVAVLELAPEMPRTALWLVRTMTAGSIITAILAISVSYGAGVAPAQLIAFIEVVVVIVISVKLLKKGHRPAGFFLAAFGFYCTGTLLRVARNFMLLPPNVLTDNSFQIGAIAHMILMSLAISNRYNAMKAAAAFAQAEALRHKTARAEALEMEVSARTASLTAEIEQREKLEKELREALEVEITARQQQREFVSMVSHEFRTPLAIIDTSSQRIAGSMPPDATLERCTNIREATRRMTRLIDEFLSLDRLDGDLRAFHAIPENTVDMIRGAAAEWDQGRIVVECAHLPDTLTCDAGLLRVALRNLLANAIRHSPDDVAVQFRCLGLQDQGVTFEVIDAGSGIPPDEIPKLFQKYFRGRGAQHKPGAGLGLYLVERIAKLHGGSIQVHSSPAGSRFVLSIPEGSGAPKALPIQSAAQPTGTNDVESRKE